MPIVRQYRIWCSTEASFVSEDVWRTSAPTQCPNNAAHTIDTDKTVTTAMVGSEHPMAEDGKEYVTPDLFPQGYYRYYSGAPDEKFTPWDSTTTFNVGDLVCWKGVHYKCTAQHSGQEPPNASYWTTHSGVGTGTGFGVRVSITDWSNTVQYEVDELVRNDGSLYKCKSQHTNQEPPNGTYWDAYTGEDLDIEFFMTEHSRIVGGMISRKNGGFGDYISWRVVAPETAAVANAGSGNINSTEIVPSSGLYIYTPAAGDGSHDVDLWAACPVPNVSNQGYWDYDTANNVVVPNAGGAGKYDLYSFSNDLGRQINRVWLLGDGDKTLTLPAVLAKTLPHTWKHIVTVHHNGGDNNLEVHWEMDMGRHHTL